MHTRVRDRDRRREADVTIEEKNATLGERERGGEEERCNSLSRVQMKERGKKKKRDKWGEDIVRERGKQELRRRGEDEVVEEFFFHLRAQAFAHE